MTTALAPPPPWWQLLYSPRAWRTRMAATKARFEAEHLAWNYDAVAPHVAPGARVLDLGAWDCRLLAALRDRLGARVVGADAASTYSSFSGNHQRVAPSARWSRTTRPASANRAVQPARDEAHNLPRLLASLARLAPAAHEVIVVDDHSTDGTGELARAAGATVITPPPLAPGWLGKSWACHAGAQVATGDYLLFTDADTEHGPGALGLALARAATAELVSIVPTHRVEAGWEKLQGPFQLMLLVAGRAGAEATHGARRYSIGQYLLFERATYLRIGGHAAIAGEIAEDLHLAARVVDGGGRFALVHAPGALGVRMYPEGVAGFALALLVTLTYRNSWGMPFHTENLLVLHALVLAVVPAADAWSVDARGRAAPAAERYGWPLRALAVITVIAYVLAGIAKLRLGGWAWTDGDALREQIAIDNLRKHLMGAPMSPVAAAFLEHTWMMSALAIGTMVVELGAPVALLHRRIAAAWAVAAWGFHVGVVVLMAIVFPVSYTHLTLPTSDLV